MPSVALGSSVSVSRVADSSRDDKSSPGVCLADQRTGQTKPVRRPMLKALVDIAGMTGVKRTLAAALADCIALRVLMLERVGQPIHRGPGVAIETPGHGEIYRERGKFSRLHRHNLLQNLSANREQSR